MIRPLAREAGRFGIVGVAATLMHAGMAQLAHSLLAQPPLVANVMGFLAAFVISYGGHYHWTFASGVPHGTSLPRFLVVSLAAFMISEFIVWVVTGVMGLSMAVAMATVVGVVPLASFLINRNWTFAAGNATRIHAPVTDGARTECK